MDKFPRLPGRLLHGAGRSVSYAGVRMVALLPSSCWYPALWRISRAQAFLLRPLFHIGHYRSDPRRAVPVVWMLNHWIGRLAAARGPFPIPTRVTGAELIEDLYRNPSGVALCSAHVPLLDLCLQSLIDLQCPPSAVLAGRSLLVDGKFPVLARPLLPAIPTGPAMLLKARSVLRGGGMMAALVDLDRGRAYSPNLFRLVRRTGARAVFVIPELASDGVIEVNFFLPPDPSCQTDESINMSLEVLGKWVDRVLGRLPHTVEPIAAVPSRPLVRDPPIPDKCQA